MIKRTITLAGHQTSVALEKEFWDALDEIAAQRETGWAQVVADVDAARQGANLASALRLAALDYFRRDRKA
ncbi:MAG: ribbon-helix-helix domain-containing protein [Hyphomicrobiaceae bacterium]|nr:ribbon-helix-helix domain-containing protein [Hyphomicrobiaceae bacterium]